MISNHNLNSKSGPTQILGLTGEWRGPIGRMSIFKNKIKKLGFKLEFGPSPLNLEFCFFACDYD